MADIAHVWGQDLQLSPSGDLAVVSDTPSFGAETQQRILHRLLTNLGDYIWQLTYGAGLPAFVGMPPNQGEIVGIINQQLTLEPTVASAPAPTVNVVRDGVGNLTVTIVYYDAQTGLVQPPLTFPVTA